MENVREELDRLIRQRNVGYSAVSRLLNRNPAYIQQFIKRGSPRKLDDEDRRILAQFFGVDEQVLGGPALPVRDGLVEVPILNVDASAGFGAIAESETAHTRFGFDERWLGKLTRAKGPSLSIIHVHGESMEPTLRDGDEVLVDASDQGSRLRDGIYVLRDDDALTELLAEYPQADSQQLRTMIREGRKELAANAALRPGQEPLRKHYRALFQALRQLQDPDEQP